MLPNIYNNHTIMNLHIWKPHSLYKAIVLSVGTIESIVILKKLIFGIYKGRKILKYKMGAFKKSTNCKKY